MTRNSPRFLCAALLGLMLCLGELEIAANPPAARPEGRNKPFFIYDAAVHALVLFGGYDRDGKLLGDTWTRDAKTWRKLEFEKGEPAPRGGPGMAYDEARGRGVMFGGRGGAGLLADTWEWDGRRWHPTAAAGPPARMVPQMAYDGAARRVVLFGGLDSDQKRIFGDTWCWDGRTWSQADSSGPPARHHHRVVYDEARRRIVLFGGNGSLSVKEPRLFNDTWEWDGKRWTLVKASGPPARDHFAMAYDKRRGRTVLFGGWDGASFLADVWEWDGREWTRMAFSGGPSRRGGLPSMDYDPGLEEVVLFGGWGDDGPLNDLWSWNGTRWLERADR